MNGCPNISSPVLGIILQAYTYMYIYIWSYLSEREREKERERERERQTDRQTDGEKEREEGKVAFGRSVDRLTVFNLLDFYQKMDV